MGESPYYVSVQVRNFGNLSEVANRSPKAADKGEFLDSLGVNGAIVQLPRKDWN